MNAHAVTDACGPCREAAIARLQAFLPEIPRYASDRGYDADEKRCTSGLSPYVRLRLLRESEIVLAVLQQYSYEEASRFIDQLGWRTYWRGYLESHQSIWEDYKASHAHLSSTLGGQQRETWKRACAGETGIDCFDSWSRELVSTGWLHNHARMWFASVWIFTLGLPWELGAAHFSTHLLDADTATNLLSWRWVGGLHTPGKHYLARADNIRRFTLGRFFPEGRLNESAPALPFIAAAEPNPLPLANALAQSHFPDLSFCPAGLVVCPEDMTPEMRELEEMPFNSICVLNARDIMDTMAASPAVRTFINGAVADTARRLETHWDARALAVNGSVPVHRPSATPDHVGRRERPRVYSGYVDRWVESVVNWASNESLNSVSILQPPTGPWQDAMPALRGALRLRNIRLTEYRRRWDALHWPHAGEGYFRFRKGLRDRIRQFYPLA